MTADTFIQPLNPTSTGLASSTVFALAAACVYCLLGGGVSERANQHDSAVLVCFYRWLPGELALVATGLHLQRKVSLAWS